MIEKAMQWLKEEMKPEVIDFDGRSYSTRNLHPVKEPRQETLTVHTLQGIVDYLAADPDDVVIEAIPLFIHILNPDGVALLQRVTGGFLERPQIVNAQPVLPDMGNDLHGRFFGEYRPVENFLIKLKSCFVETPGLTALVQVAGNVRAEGGVHQEDDGFTQKVTARQAAARVGEVEVPNPVMLAPYRTFQEVEQPESPFIFRMKGDQQQGISCALFEADGGAWRLEAVARIETWLKGALADKGLNIPIIR